MTELQFLQQYENQAVTVFLTNGVKLQGKLGLEKDGDAYVTGGDVLYISRDGVTQTVYKHAVSTVMPQPKPNYDYDNPAHNGGY